MKTTNIGLILLTALVVTKYVITLDTYSSQDGSFKSGLTIDYTVMADFVAERTETSEPELLAYNPAITQSNSVVPVVTKKTIDQPAFQHDEVAQNTNTTPNFHTSSDEVLPMEHSNSLVVFDPTSPAITDMKTQYVDQYDNAAPLDHGNTVVNEMLMMMPRR